MRFLFRLLSMFALAVAVIMAVADATRIVAAAGWTFTPLRESWEAVSSDTLERLRTAFEGHALAAVWEPATGFVLALPGWLVFGVLAFVFHALGHRRRLVTFAGR